MSEQRKESAVRQQIATPSHASLSAPDPLAVQRQLDARYLRCPLALSRPPFNTKVRLKNVPAHVFPAATQVDDGAEAMRLCPDLPLPTS